MNHQLAQRIIAENPTFVSPDDDKDGAATATAKLVLDRMQDELDSIPLEMSVERYQLRQRIEQYNYEPAPAGPATNRPSVQAAEAALKAHETALGIEGDASIQVWHLLVSLHAYCAEHGVDFDQELREVKKDIASGASLKQ